MNFDSNFAHHEQFNMISLKIGYQKKEDEMNRLLFDICML